MGGGPISVSGMVPRRGHGGPSARSQIPPSGPGKGSDRRTPAPSGSETCSCDLINCVSGCHVTRGDDCVVRLSVSTIRRKAKCTVSYTCSLGGSGYLGQQESKRWECPPPSLGSSVR